MRLIDADDLDNVVLRLNEEGRTVTRSEYKTLDSIIFEFPTIEAEPVRRGHWVGIDDFPHETWECDQCGYIHEELGGWVPRYCPDCGAKMEEQE